MIARYFDVSTDTLFDMDTRDREQTKECYESSYKTHRQHGEIEQCREVMTDALEQFPRDYHFMMNLAETLCLYEGGTATQKAIYAEERLALQIHSLCQRVMEDCQNEQERCRAIYLLCGYYTQTGNTAKALQLVEGVADMAHCRDVLLGNILTGDKKVHQLQQNLLTAVDYAATTLVDMAFRKECGIAPRLSTEDRIEYVKTANALYALLMPDGNYQFYHRIVGWNHRRLAELYLLGGDVDKAFVELLLAEKHAVCYDRLQKHQYTAVFVNTLTYDPAEYYKCWTGSECGMLLYRLNELVSYFEGHSDFEAMRTRLQEATKDDVAVSIE